MRRPFVLTAGLVLLALTLLACGNTATVTPTPVTPTPQTTVPPTPPSTDIPTPQGSPTSVPEERGVFRVVLVMPDGTYPLPVVLRDPTGLVSGLTARQPGLPPFDEGVTNPAGQASVLSYGWVGGACDTLTTITFERGDPGFRITAETTKRGDMCILIGLFRSVEIHLTAPIDAKSVIVTAR